MLDVCLDCILNLLAPFIYSPNLVLVYYYLLWVRVWFMGYLLCLNSTAFYLPFVHKAGFETVCLSYHRERI